MVRLVHSTVHWRLRCIVDTSSSEDENTPPNVASSFPTVDSTRATKTEDDASSGGTATPPWLPPGTSKLGLPKEVTNPPPSSPEVLRPRSPTTSSPVLLNTPPRSPLKPTSRSPLVPTPRSPLMPTSRSATARSRRQTRRTASAPYSRPRVPVEQGARAVIAHQERRFAAPNEVLRPSRASAPGDEFALARWPCGVAHLREQFNPLATLFPSVPSFGWCTCSSPCRTDTCRNAKMNVYCGSNCCPYEGKCGNGLLESEKLCIMRNRRTSTLSVVAAEDIDAGVVLGQYLGELEHVRASNRDRPRNNGYRLVMKTRPEKPALPVRVAINAKKMGGTMRFVNHSCEPVAEFREVANGRRTTVVVATTDYIRGGDEITVDYGDDLWFVCRCGATTCRHRDIQDQQDP